MALPHAKISFLASDNVAERVSNVAMIDSGFPRAGFGFRILVIFANLLSGPPKKQHPAKVTHSRRARIILCCAPKTIATLASFSRLSSSKVRTTVKLPTNATGCEKKVKHSLSEFVERDKGRVPFAMGFSSATA